MKFYSNSQERIRIDSNGNFAIGTAYKHFFTLEKVGSNYRVAVYTTSCLDWIFAQSFDLWQKDKQKDKNSFGYAQVLIIDECLYTMLILKWP